MGFFAVVFYYALESKFGNARQWSQTFQCIIEKKLQKSPFLINFGPISGPPDGLLGFPGSSKMALINRPSHWQSLTSLRGIAKLTFQCIIEKNCKEAHFLSILTPSKTHQKVCLAFQTHPEWPQLTGPVTDKIWFHCRALQNLLSSA